MRPIITGKFFMAAALLVSAGVAMAADPGPAAAPTSDAGIAESVRHQIAMYPKYSIWDDVNIEVVDGSVHLTGAVNQPFKKAEITKLVRRLPGVAALQNDLRVLPLSTHDDILRVQVARAIYRDAGMLRYAMQPMAPIHILVENGHVTLAGVVASETDRSIAEVRASGAGLSFGKVDNQLRVENPAKKS